MKTVCYFKKPILKQKLRHYRRDNSSKQCHLVAMYRYYRNPNAAKYSPLNLFWREFKGMHFLFQNGALNYPQCLLISSRMVNSKGIYMMCFQLCFKNPNEKTLFRSGLMVRKAENLLQRGIWGIHYNQQTGVSLTIPRFQQELVEHPS